MSRCVQNFYWYCMINFIFLPFTFTPVIAQNLVTVLAHPNCVDWQFVGPIGVQRVHFTSQSVSCVVLSMVAWRVGLIQGNSVPQNEWQNVTKPGQIISNHQSQVKVGSQVLRHQVHVKSQVKFYFLSSRVSSHQMCDSSQTRVQVMWLKSTPLVCHLRSQQRMVVQGSHFWLLRCIPCVFNNINGSSVQFLQ
jgi:hypothetical protein